MRTYILAPVRPYSVLGRKVCVVLNRPRRLRPTAHRLQLVFCTSNSTPTFGMSSAQSTTFVEKDSLCAKVSVSTRCFWSKRCASAVDMCTRRRVNTPSTLSGFSKYLFTKCYKNCGKVNIFTITLQIKMTKISVEGGGGGGKGR